MRNFLALFFLFLAIGLFIYADYLGQSEMYIFNYRLLFTLFVISFSTAIIQAILINSIRNELPVFPLLGGFGLYLFLILLSDFINSFINFQFDIDISVVLYSLCFLFYARELLLYIHNKRITFFALLPVFALTIYSFLASNNFFSQRAGSYPIYTHHLRQNIWFKERVKSIDEFFNIDKTE